MNWRVGWLAHGPLRNRCPRAAPNPSDSRMRSEPVSLNGPIAPLLAVRGLWYWFRLQRSRELATKSLNMQNLSEFPSACTSSPTIVLSKLA